MPRGSAFRICLWQIQHGSRRRAGARMGIQSDAFGGRDGADQQSVAYPLRGSLTPDGVHLGPVLWYYQWSNERYALRAFSTIELLVTPSLLASATKASATSGLIRNPTVVASPFFFLPAPSRLPPHCLLTCSRLSCRGSSVRPFCSGSSVRQPRSGPTPNPILSTQRAVFVDKP